ncbi:MAG: TM0106 family RecB-like putative nuclease [Candidatus Eremiobacteraeota bacterium]|nr:TM0106 family RecB-like putative nuclease [Candidatus Eremiobacteraeota bacterium]
MQSIEGRYVYSASDLNNYLECEHLTELERLVALGERQRPEQDASSELIARKGAEHEANHYQRLKALHGDDVTAFPERTENTIVGMQLAEAATVAAMERGAKIIYQATFFDGTFLGRADFLRRIETPSARWAWSYEVVDTKLALNPKPYYLIQLCNYSEHLARVQGCAPEYGYIVLGSGAERKFRIDDYAAYYRHLKKSFLGRVDLLADTYPLVCSYCESCRWSELCEKRRDDDDHLSIVAWMRRDQMAKLEDAGITTLAQLASAEAGARPRGMSQTSFDNLRAQARLQHRQRRAFAENAPGKRHFFEFRDYDPGTGFAKLPVPATGDVFFDMEGDPLYRPDRGLEYLFGVYLPDENEYKGFWARNAAEERAAFETFMDFICARLAQYPDLHVYHYAPYETTALKRLMGVFASRENELDEFLRRGIFVDLYGVVRQGIRISQPSYSIKKLEAFYEMKRQTITQRGDDSIVMFESWLATGDDNLLEDIERYNEDDCRSTHLLRDWLVERRDELSLTLPQPLPWWTAPESKAPQDDAERSDLEHRLLDGLPTPDSLDALRGSSESVRARWLLGNLLQYHRRENKPGWWQYYERRENPDQLEEHDHEAIGGLRYRDDIASYIRPGEKTPVYTYEYPAQEHNLKTNKPMDPYSGKGAGEVVRLDDTERIIEIKINSKIEPQSLRSLIPGTPISNNAQRKAIETAADSYIVGDLVTRFPATNDLLLSRNPRLRGYESGSMIQPDVVDAPSISTIVSALDNSYLFIQGPPGTGKTTHGAACIVDLIADGKRVGVLANSHKAIHNLVRKVELEAARRNVTFCGFHKETSTEGSSYVSPLDAPMVSSTGDLSTFVTSQCQLASGTTYAWTHESLLGKFDHLFIDEAGQIALADAVGASLAAKNVVLLGDPLQLAQVSQGSHPVGTELSILEHLLGDDVTVPEYRGIFLDVSYRLPAAICNFISDAVYAGRLHSDAETKYNDIDSLGISGVGLRYVPIEHAGNRRKSIEEAEAIAEHVTKLLEGTVTIGGLSPRKVGQSDILVVSPYNAQRKQILETLAARGFPAIRVGTVDKFQGQEAPIVFYSMATSSGADLPRDIGFLFEKNRLNVAISRAQCLSVLLASSPLLEVRCNRPEQMALANLLCSYVETAKIFEVSGAMFAPTLSAATSGS